MGEAVLTRLEGEAPEAAIANDLVKKAVMIAPVAIVLGALVWRGGGAIATAFAVVIVALNFLLAAASMSYTAKISVGLMMGTALFGYLLRLGLIMAAFFLVKDTWWMKEGIIPFGLTLVVTHLVLLFWEMKFVSATLAFPGLKPAVSKES